MADEYSPQSPADSDSTRGLSRRELIGRSLAAGVALTVNGPAAPPVEAQVQGAGAAAAGPEELWLINGRIHTMDRNNTIAKTVSIRNGRFVSVNANAPKPRPGIRVIDLRGRTGVPGLIDNHNHIVLMGNRPGYHTPLENAYSIRDAQEIIAARAKAIPRGAWITTIGGFHRNHLVPPSEMPRLPSLAELDDAAPNNPVYISEAFMGPSTTNTLGKKFFESQNPPIPVGADGSIANGAQVTGRATLALRQTLLNPHMYYATTGLNARQVLINGGQTISRQEVLRLYTATNGWFLREESQIGTIEPGRLGDLAVLSHDYFSVADEDLKRIRSVLTVVGGRITHDAGVL